MNDNILKLARQSNLAELYDMYVHAAIKNGYDIMDFEEIVGGFAKLIVRECAEVIQSKSIGSGDEWEQGLLIAEVAIREHFGCDDKESATVENDEQ